MSLLHPDETAPASGKYFTKFPEGKTKIHIFSQYMLQYYEAWAEDKTSFSAKTAKALLPKIEEAIKEGKIFKDKKPQYKTAMVCAIWDSKGVPEIKILKLSQASLVNSLIDIDNSPEWGGVQTHPLEIKREGSGQYGTKYSTNSLPHAPFPQELLVEANSVSMAQLLVDGGDPFGEDQATHQNIQGTFPTPPTSQQAPLPSAGTPETPYEQ